MLLHTLIAWSPVLIVSVVPPISSFRVASSSTSSETASSILKAWWLLFLLSIILSTFQEAASPISAEAISPVVSKVDSAFTLKARYLSFDCVWPLHFPLLTRSPFINIAWASFFLLNGDACISDYWLCITCLLPISSHLFCGAWSFACCRWHWRNSTWRRWRSQYNIAFLLYHEVRYPIF